MASADANTTDPGELAAEFLERELDAGATQTEIAQQTGIPQTTISGIIRKRSASAKTLKLLQQVPAYRAFIREMATEIDGSQLSELRDERWLRLAVRTQYTLDLRNARRLIELMEEAKRFGIAEAAIQHLASFLDSVRTVALQERSDALEEALAGKSTADTKSLESA